MEKLTTQLGNAPIQIVRIYLDSLLNEYIPFLW